MLVSVVQQCESAICRHISPPSWASLLLPHPIQLSHHRASSWAPYVIPQVPTSSVLRMVVYIWQCYSLNSSHPLLPALDPQVCSLCLHLCLEGILESKGFPGDSAGKESACNVGDLGLIPGLGRSPGVGNGYPLQHSGLENSMECIVHGWQRVGHDWMTFTSLSLREQTSFNECQPIHNIPLWALHSARYSQRELRVSNT